MKYTNDVVEDFCFGGILGNKYCYRTKAPCYYVLALSRYRSLRRPCLYGTDRLADGSGPGPNLGLNPTRSRVGTGPGTEKSFQVRPAHLHVSKKFIVHAKHWLEDDHASVFFVSQ